MHVVEGMDVTDLPLDSIASLGVAAMGRFVSEYPLLNSHLEQDEVTCFDRCDVGVAVDTGRGLMVPVLRDCRNRSVEDLQAETASLAEKARAGRLTRGDVSDATITLIRPAIAAACWATPLINPPRTEIVAIHRAATARSARELTHQSHRQLRATFDHRIIDGAPAGDFTLALAREVTGGVSDRTSHHPAEPVS